ncbi:MAG: hypothetical protein Q4D54_00530 [Eubacteriales bacterium]|nr:hypothetical protein [Eubacteriales bacterium]
MDSVFYKEWFQGFSEGLEALDDNSRQCLLRCCAKKCADTGIVEIYKKHYIKVQGNRDEFYRTIEELGGARGEVITPGKVYAIIFPQCVCDLHTTGGVNSQSLCECSRQSIVYVGRMIWGEDTRFSVKNQGTVLSGNKECRFIIEFE